ncbi:hypothetical protein FHD45_14645 [Escherichia coli]|nr:hypothetical protein [Escherichia coli]
MLPVPRYPSDETQSEQSCAASGHESDDHFPWLTPVYVICLLFFMLRAAHGKVNKDAALSWCSGVKTG